MTTATATKTASVIVEEQIEVPFDVQSFEKFRQWTRSDEFPEIGRIDYIEGDIYVNLLPCPYRSYGGLMTELVYGLEVLNKAESLGELFVFDARLVLPSDDLNTSPDLMFVSNASWDTNRVEFRDTTRYRDDIDVNGFQRSVVFARNFQFTRERGRRNHWKYDLRTKQ